MKPIKKIIQEHKKTFPRAVIEGIILTVIIYGLGVLLVDLMGIQYYLVGLYLIPLTFTIKYILNKYWVYN